MSHHEDDDLFDVVYSLPLLASSVAISTRTPTAGFTQDSKFMPDFGGVLEIPGSYVKNNSLTADVPFTVRTNLQELSSLNPPNSGEINIPLVNDCLTLSTYSDIHDDVSKFSIILALNDKLKFLLVDEVNNPDEPDIPARSSQLYHLEKYHKRLTGIKYNENNPDILLVKLERSLSLVKLNQLYQLSNDTDSTKSQDETTSSSQPINSTNLSVEGQEFSVKDVCLNPYNGSILAVASDNHEAEQVKLYDLSSTSFRKPFSTLTWDNTDTEARNVELIRDELILRKRVVRTFSSYKPAVRGVQQLDHIPHHLVNMILTTGSRTVLFDPRMDRIAQTFVNRSKIPSFYPIEFLRRTEYSQRNSYQFYSLSNVHIRVFDTRYSRVPLNQVNHMLDSDSSSLNLKTINFSNNLETCCIANHDRLSFVTFDQAQKDNLVNPKSTHLPYHERSYCETTLEEISDMAGLLVKINEEDASFSLIQAANGGSVYIRSYTIEPNSNRNPANSRDQPIIRTIKISDLSLNESHSSLDYRDSLETLELDDKREYLDVLEPDILGYSEEMFESKRAYERFEKMKNALNG